MCLIADLLNLVISRLGSSYVSNLFFSPDNHYLLIGTNTTAERSKGSVSLINIEASEILFSYGHSRYLWDAKISPNGKLVVSLGLEDRIKVWDIPTRKQLFKVKSTKPTSVKKRYPKYIAFGKENDIIPIGFSNGDIQHLDIISKYFLPIKINLGKNITYLKTASSGETLLAKESKGKLAVLKFETLELIYQINPFKDKDYSIAWSMDNRFIITNSIKEGIKIIDYSHGEIIEEFHIERKKKEVFNSISLTPDNYYLVCISNLNFIKIIKLNTKELIWEMELKKKEVVDMFLFTPDNKYFIFGTKFNTIRILDLTTKRIINELNFSKIPITCMEISLNGQYLALGTSKKKNLIILYKLAELIT